MNRDDPNGWRRTYVEESARAPARAGPVDIGVRFGLAFCVAFVPLSMLADALIGRFAS